MGGVVLIVFAAYLALICVNSRRAALAAARAAAKNKDVEEVVSESAEDIASRQALEASRQAQRAALHEKHRVEPEKDPESLEEAKAMCRLLQRVINTPKMGPYDRLKLDWLKAHVTYWVAFEDIQVDAAKKANVEFCLENDLLELEDDSPKYSKQVLLDKKVPELRKLAAAEEIEVAEPFLFGKKAYFVGILAGVKPKVGGMREFVQKKIDKIELVKAQMAYAQERITFFKEKLEDAKVAAAEAIEREETEALEEGYLRQEFLKKEALRRALLASKRADKEALREAAKQVVLMCLVSYVYESCLLCM